MLAAASGHVNFAVSGGEGFLRNQTVEFRARRRAIQTEASASRTKPKPSNVAEPGSGVETGGVAFAGPPTP